MYTVILSDDQMNLLLRVLTQTPFTGNIQQLEGITQQVKALLGALNTAIVETKNSSVPLPVDLSTG